MATWSVPDGRRALLDRQARQRLEFDHDDAERRRALRLDDLAVGVDDLGVALERRLGDLRRRRRRATVSSSEPGSGRAGVWRRPRRRRPTSGPARSTFWLRLVNRSSNVLRRLSARTNEPTTNETPTRMAMEMAMRRPRRARMLRRAMRAVDPVLMSVPEALHAVEDLLGRRVGHLVDDPAVGEEHDAVGVRRAAVGSWVTITIVWPYSRTARRMKSRISAPVRRVEVARRLVGEDDRPASLARARATATRCCWPPDSSLGRCFSRSRRPTVVTTSSIHCLVAARRRRASAAA